MTSEANWLGLYTRLGEVLGPEHAETLMTGFSTRADVLELKDAIAALDRRFDRVDGRFDRVDDRFDRVDDRLDGIDARFDRIDARLDRFDARFERMDARFERVDDRLGSFGEQLQGLYKTIVWAVVASVTVLAGIFSAIITILIR